jgi:peptide/nickel transport system substrate-binding protein
MKRLYIVLVLVLGFVLTACTSTNTATSPVQSTAAKATTTSAPTVATSTAVSQASAASSTPKRGGILKAVPKNATQAFGYPTDMVYPAASEWTVPCLDSLVGMDAKGNFIPTQLSTAYQVAPDGKSLTLALRKGVKFHDGSAFNASVAKWNLDIMVKAKIPGFETWTSVDAVDDYTLRISFPQYLNTMLYQIASNGKMISQAATEKNGIESAHTHPVGTGPFKFVSYTPNVSLKYERNDDYWGEKPYLDGIEYSLITDEMAKSAALESGGVDIIFNTTPQTGEALRKKGYIVGMAKENLIYLCPDSVNESSPLSNLKVRQAIEYAIDRKALKELGNGFWSAVNQPSTSSTPGYVKNFEGREYNVNKAKQLLAEAGFANGFKMTIVYSKSLVIPDDAMAVVQKYLSAVGITTDLQPVPANQRTDFTVNGWKNGVIAGGTYSGLDYLTALQRNFGGKMFISMEKPADFVKVLNQAATAIDTPTMEKFSQQVNMLIHENAMFTPLWAAPQNIFVEQTYVKDAALYETGGTYDWTPGKTWLSK